MQSDVDESFASFFTLGTTIRDVRTCFVHLGVFSKSTL